MIWNPLRMIGIVEGHGEDKAFSGLVTRIARSIDPSIWIDFPLLIRRPAGQVLRPGGLERDVELAARKLGGRGAILVLLDADDDEKCPATLGPSLLARATDARSDLPIGVVLAKQEFESWFIAAASSLQGVAGLPTGLRAPDNAEDIRGAKEWLRRQMPRGQTYRPTLHQATFAARFDVHLARQRSDSFDKCCREVERLIRELQERTL